MIIWMGIGLVGGGRVGPPGGSAFVTHNGEPVTFNGNRVYVRIN